MSKFLIDTAERVGTTFLFGFLAAFSLTGVSDLKSLEVAAGAAALSGLKAVIAFYKSGGTGAGLADSK